MRFRATTRAVLLICFLTTSIAHAQQMSTTAGTAPSAEARRQIEEVKRATSQLASTEQAAAGGYVLAFHWLPTMGEHWINPKRQQDGSSVVLDAPDQLMFSPVNGKPQLVGAAYSFIASLADAARPATFDGNPAWHDHPQFAPEGKTLAMLHVWFVPSPDGPFAGHNPNLPFWALGLTPPDARRFMDHEEGIRIRKAALALGILVDTAGIFPTLAERPAMRDVLAAQRQALRALLPALDAKEVTDWAAWDRAADDAAARWDTIRAAYLATVRTPAIRERMIKAMDEMETGAHGHM